MRGLKNAQLTNIPPFLSRARFTPKAAVAQRRSAPPFTIRRKNTGARRVLEDKIQSCDDGIGGGRTEGKKTVCVPLPIQLEPQRQQVFSTKKKGSRRNKTLLLRSPSVLPERRRRRTRRPWHPLKRKKEEGPALVLGAMTKTQKRAPASSSDRPTPMDRSYLL